MMKEVIIDLNKEKLVHCTPPHAPVFVTTINFDGSYNIGTFEQFMNISNFPPRILLGITSESMTFKNIKRGSDFSIGIPSVNSIEQLTICGKSYAEKINKFDLSNFTKRKAKFIQVPHIVECSINIECILNKEYNVGDHHIIIGDVLNASMQENIYDKDKIKRRANIQAPYHISSNQFKTLSLSYLGE